MKRVTVGLVGIMAILPQMLWAADLQMFAPIGPIGMGIAAAGYLFGGASVVWAGAHAIQSYRNREIEGMGAMWGWLAATVIGAILVGTIVPQFVEPILARGATL